jgi:putative addiction module component (TIGR02574 family)
MPLPVKNLLDQVLRLPPAERAVLVETLISSLDSPDPSMDAKWRQEAEDRLAAFRAGEIEAEDADAVFRELDER